MKSRACCFAQELEGLHALVIPGGESTVILKLLVEFGMFDEVQKFGRSVSSSVACVNSWEASTCAGKASDRHGTFAKTNKRQGIITHEDHGNFLPLSKN